MLWGVAITDTTGKLVYGRNADRLFVPASNAKLLTIATATALLGPSFTVPTSVYATGPIVDGVLQGELVLYGRGDPTFSRRCYTVDTSRTNACDTDPASQLRALALQLRARGVKTIAGHLIGDGSYFEPELVHPNWQTYDLGWWYAAPVSGLGFNDNSLDVHEAPGDSAGAPARITLVPDVGIATLDNRSETGARGSRRTIDIFRSATGTTYRAEGVVPLGANERVEYAAVADPNRFTALAFRRELAAVGIAVRGETRSVVDSLTYRAARSTPPIAEVTSRALRDWIFPVLSTSQNWFAEMIIKQLGKQRGNAGSWSEGTRVVRRFLIDSVHADSLQFELEDGSGLAANNLISPLTFTQVIGFMRRHPNFPMFDAALPVSGNSGSMRSRLGDTASIGRVHAKTGSISRTNTLSGYVQRADGRILLFSIEANHHTLGSAKILAAIDAVVGEMLKADVGR